MQFARHILNVVSNSKQTRKIYKGYMLMSDMAKEILKVASKAVKKAQRKSLENGVANVYSKNGYCF